MAPDVLACHHDRAVGPTERRRVQGTRLVEDGLRITEPAGQRGRALVGAPIDESAVIPRLTGRVNYKPFSGFKEGDAVAVVMPDTATGCLRVVVVPSPSWPAHTPNWWPL